MRARVNPQTTDQIATFDTHLYPIPVNAILALGISFYKDLSDAEPKILAQKEYTEDHLSAFVNMTNQLIASGRCSHFFTIIADTLAALRYSDSDLTPYTQAGISYLSDNQALFDFGKQQPNFLVHTTWNDWYSINNASTSKLALVQRNSISRLLQRFKPEKLPLRTNRENRTDSEPPPASPKITATRGHKHKSLPATFLSHAHDSADYLEEKEHPVYVPEESVGTFDTFAAYKKVLDDRSQLPRHKDIGKLLPSFEVATEYVAHMFNNPDCPHHTGFKKAVECVLNIRLSNVIAKMRNKHKRENDAEFEISQSSKEIESQKILNFMLNECAHHLALGITARKLDTPFRVFHKDGFNEAMVFIENRIIGQLPISGYTALKGVDLKFVEKKHAKKWFEGKDNFFAQRYSPRRHLMISNVLPRTTQEKRLIPPAELLIDATLFLIQPTSRQVVEKLLRLLEKTISSKTPPSTAGSTPDSQESSPRVYALSDNPTNEEVVAALLRYFADPQTPAHVLIDFKESLLDQLTYTPTPALGSSPNSLRNSPKSEGDAFTSSGEHLIF